MRIDIEILNKLDGQRVRVVMPRAAIVGTLRIIRSEYRVSDEDNRTYVNFTADDVSLTQDNRCDPYAAIVVLR